MLYLVSLLSVVTACSTINNVNDSLKNHLNPAVDSIKNVADKTLVLETNLVNTVSTLNDVINQAQQTITNVEKETTKTMIEVQQTLADIQVMLANSVLLLNETRQSIVNINSIVASNIPDVLNEITKTLQTIQITTSGIHDSQQDYHKFITDNWGKIVLVIITLILLSIFHGVIQRLIVGKRK